MLPSLCRWGILGTANIARKNWKALRLASNATITAVASRETAKAQRFIDECQADVSFAPAPTGCGYDDLLKRSDVDAVYIPLPTGIRREWVVKAAQAGKHVLCEKPCGTNAVDVRAMLDACQANRVQFMDGVMFMHSARLPLLRKILDDGQSVGDVRRIATQFCFAGDDAFMNSNIRVDTALEPLGALGDLGWYNIRLALWIMKYQSPTHVSGRIIAEHRGVPTEFSGELFFPGGATAEFYCSFRTENHQWVHVSGNRGSVSMPDFVLPFYGGESAFEVDCPKFEKRGCGFHMVSRPQRYGVPEYSDGEANSQETNMVRTFSNLALSGKLDPTWGELALQTQVVLDACLRSAREGGMLLALS